MMMSKLCGFVALAVAAVAHGFVFSTTSSTTRSRRNPAAPTSDAGQWSIPTHAITTRSKPSLSSRRWLSQQYEQNIDTYTCYIDDNEQEASSPARRNAVLSTAAASLLSCSSVLLRNAPAIAAAPETPAVATSPEKAVVTDKVFFDVRISRQDGTFYVRDDLPDTIENQVFTGRLTIGLFGKAAPNHVQRFLGYVNTGNKPLDDNPLPSYGRSVFPQLDEATGVLYGGTIPSLEVTELQGSAAIRYGGRLLPAKLWVNAQEATTTKLSHYGKGLLTHKNLDVTPCFGITTRTDTTELDRTHTVFGRLLPDADSQAFLERVASLPVYSVGRPVPTDRDETAVDDAAAALYALQRDFFRGAAKNLGDTRIDKLVAGKLLRRVEVTQVGMA